MKSKLTAESQTKKRKRTSPKPLPTPPVQSPFWAGVASPQSPSEMHSTQLPERQWGLVALQFELARHCTHPSVESHSGPLLARVMSLGHWFVPFGPQRAPLPLSHPAARRVTAALARTNRVSIAITSTLPRQPEVGDLASLGTANPPAHMERRAGRLIFDIFVMDHCVR